MLSGLFLPCFMILFLGAHCTTGQDVHAFEPGAAVQIHNEHRRKQNASNMNALIWDETLAEQTANYARQCNFEHDQSSNDGENIYVTSKTVSPLFLKLAIDSWYDEIKHYNLLQATCAQNEVCGHYTQVVWATSRRIGCAVVKCASIAGLPPSFSGSGTLVFCRYSPPGNFQGQRPFRSGAICSECPSGWSCEKGLCNEHATSPTTKPSVKTVTTADPKTTTAVDASRIETTQGMIRPTKEPVKTTDSFSSTPSSNTPKSPYTTGATRPTKEPYKTTVAFSSPPNPNKPHTTGSPTAPPPQMTCSKEYLETLRDYNELLDEYKREFNKWRGHQDGC